MSFLTLEPRGLVGGKGQLWGWPLPLEVPPTLQGPRRLWVGGAARAAESEGAGPASWRRAGSRQCRRDCTEPGAASHTAGSPRPHAQHPSLPACLPACPAAARCHTL